ncbi:hypothetical protein MLD38_010342 [Melastoma candidum]|uniref:Uncharacterized protein n=1 Tax=Melastoma candidum TaxID=119954 RepID=A0ACB9QZI5_9MYRT|nr:hypothetical protein MLD38_010342 [Melastoma candidum]
MARDVVIKSKSLQPSAAATKNLPDASPSSSSFDAVSRLASGNAVVLFSMTGCCMCTVAKRLLFGLGVGPMVIELDELGGEGGGGIESSRDIEAVLFRLADDGGKKQPVPAVFVGGKFLGGIETLMASHINGTLVPLLKDAGALWL